MIQPRKWSVPLGSGADVQDLPDDDLRYASFSKIFPQITQVPLSAGGVAPRRVDFNSLFKLLADNIYYYQNGGVFEYSDTADYEKGALVRYNDKIYLCIQDNSALNTHNPEDMDYWLKVALNNDLANYLPLTGGNITGNLTVQNKNVVRSVNGVNADAEGNVSMMQIPDYSAGVTLYANSLIPTNGILSCFFVENASGQWCNVLLDRVVVANHQSGANINDSLSSVLISVIANKGQKITTNGAFQSITFTFYPFKVVS